MERTVRCENKQEFDALIKHIFFSKNRIRQHFGEVTDHAYEAIQGALGIVEEHDDECLDLEKEYNKGNHRYAQQTYPVYVGWDYTHHGESHFSTYFQVYSVDEMSVQRVFRHQMILENNKRDRQIEW